MTARDRAVSGRPAPCRRSRRRNRLPSRRVVFLVERCISEIGSCTRRSVPCARCLVEFRRQTSIDNACQSACSAIARTSAASSQLTQTTGWRVVLLECRDFPTCVFSRNGTTIRDHGTKCCRRRNCDLPTSVPETPEFAACDVVLGHRHARLSMTTSSGPWPSPILSRNDETRFADGGDVFQSFFRRVAIRIELLCFFECGFRGRPCRRAAACRLALRDERRRGGLDAPAQSLSELPYRRARLVATSAARLQESFVRIARDRFAPRFFSA